MKVFGSKQKNSSRQSIFRWFIVRFIVFSIIFILALIPSLIYIKQVYTDLEIKKNTQHTGFGISQIENTVSGINSAATNLQKDTRFLPFYYYETNLSAIPTMTGIQLKDQLDSLMFPLPLVSDWVLQFDANNAITSYRLVSSNDSYGYFNAMLKIKDLSYEQWEKLLIDNQVGFLGVYRVSFYDSTYDALIYSVPWANDSFLFACLNVNDIKASLMEKGHRNSFYFSLSRNDGTLLYTDIPEDAPRCRTVTEKTSAGNLVITVHIPDSALGERLDPLYYFIGIYILIFALIWASAVYVSSRISSRPLMQILDILDNSHTPKESKNNTLFGNRKQQGFEFIENELHTYKRNLAEYQNTIETHKKVLQARYLEKTLHGSLVTPSDYEAFCSYFPDFPEEFCLILLGLQEEASENGNIYPDSLSLIQVLLTTCLPDIYIQQISHYELLIIMDAAQYHTCSGGINGIIANINMYEPCYHAWGLVSKRYCHPKDISFAFDQLQTLKSNLELASLSQLCNVSDDFIAVKTNLQMADILGIHTAITYGNKELALLKLDAYSSNLNRATYEIFRSVLLCIKQDYPELFSDVHIPDYNIQLDLKKILYDYLSVFCNRFQSLKVTDASSSIAQEVRAYIDLHFTEDGLNITSLADHFQCSSSKISKAFLKDFDITVASYIEKQRMRLATELLTAGEYAVAEISQKCGYTNVNTFYKAYKRIFGHSPAALREK